ncbi:cytochrome c peroxidase [Membranihabitans marinus]
MALPNKVVHPEDNPFTPEKLKLGKLLFYDPILSGNKDVACATCHHPSTGYAEFLDLSIGVNGRGLGHSRRFRQPNTIPLVKRNAPTILNTAFNGIEIGVKYQPSSAPMFWDMRTEGLEAQVLEPMMAMEEMRGQNFTKSELMVEIVKRLKSIPKYDSLFMVAFPEDKTGITMENVTKSIAVFERSLVTNHSRFDQYMRGDEEAISLSEKEGLELFTKVGCIDCHHGPMLSDFKPHVLGVAENSKLNTVDSGWMSQFAFRTPTLRNLRYTAPYMHNGSIKTLQEVMEFYEDITFKKSINHHVAQGSIDSLAVSGTIRVKDMSRIISFLNTLNDTTFDKTIPKEVPSGLPVGGLIQ